MRQFALSTSDDEDHGLSRSSGGGAARSKAGSARGGYVGARYGASAGNSNSGSGSGGASDDGYDGFTSFVASLSRSSSGGGILTGFGRLSADAAGDVSHPGSFFRHFGSRSGGAGGSGGGGGGAGGSGGISGSGSGFGRGSGQRSGPFVPRLALTEDEGEGDASDSGGENRIGVGGGGGFDGGGGGGGAGGGSGTSGDGEAPYGDDEEMAQGAAPRSRAAPAQWFSALTGRLLGQGGALAVAAHAPPERAGGHGRHRRALSFQDEFLQQSMSESWREMLNAMPTWSGSRA
jgi:hypothetical protein